MSLCRESFNHLVTRKKLDVTEVMMRHTSMGRQAELGESWCPSGLVTRRIADMLMKKREEGESNMITVPGFSLSTPKPGTAPSRGRPSSSVQKPQEVTMDRLPPPGRVPAPGSARVRGQARPMTSSPHSFGQHEDVPAAWADDGHDWAASPNNAEGPGSSTHWRPNEHALHRDSFNSIVRNQKMDVTEVMMRNASMGRQAELGPNWTPGGLASRKMADALANAPPRRPGS